MKKYFHAICILQFCLIFILAVSQAASYLDNTIENRFIIQNGIIIFLTFTTAITILMMLIQLKKYSDVHVKSLALSETISQIREFNLQLRAQRHDFINHIQIVYSLIEMDEYDEAKKYLQKIYGDLEIINRVSRTEDVAFNALLQSKASSAERRAIHMRFEITTRLRDFPVPSLDICRVISNLIDNGLQASEAYAGEKTISIEVRENVSHFMFMITNTGDTISDEVMSKIYSAGFTTKGAQGEGMGLYITKGIVEKYGGSISVKSENNLTTSTVLIPKYLTHK